MTALADLDEFDKRDAYLKLSYDYLCRSLVKLFNAALIIKEIDDTVDLEEITGHITALSNVHDFLSERVKYINERDAKERDATSPEGNQRNDLHQG